MKETTVKLFDDHDMEIVKTMRSLGQDRRTSRMVAFLLNQKEADSREIELGADLRQPEVSMAAADLIDAGWVEFKLVRDPTDPKRARKVYRLVISTKEVVEGFWDRVEEEHKIKLDAVTKLTNLFNPK